MRVAHVSKEQRLTEKQEEIRLRGLRILARMIVHAHLANIRGMADGGSASEAGDGDGQGAFRSLLASDEELPWTDGGHVR